MPVNQPQVQVTIGGDLLPGIISVEMEHVGYFAAGRFVVVCALAASPIATTSFFLGLGSETVSIEVGLAFGAVKNLFVGQIDNIRIDLRERTANLTGRDLACRLIDSEISETFANQTSGQIATTIAGRHDMTPNVTATSTPVGQYYDLDHARVALGLNSQAGTEWNLLSWLAVIEGFALSVTGTTLNFGARVSPSSMSLTPADCIEISLDTATAMPARVTVKSWNTRGKSVVDQTAGAGPGLGTSLIRPNLTPQQASLYAQKHLANLARQKNLISLVMPGEVTLFPGSTIELSQTYSSFDQSFVVETVRRSLDSRRGFTQAIRAYAVS